MTKYIFHGGGRDAVTGNNDLFYKEFMENIPIKGKVLLVYFASRADDDSEQIETETLKCLEFASSKDISINVATKENFIQEIKDADAIYFKGGSTKKLLNTLKEYPDLLHVINTGNKTVAGSSARAYALSSLYSCHYEDRAAEGIGIVPVKVVTHYGSEKMPPREGSVEILKNTRTDLDLIILKEGEWFIVNQ